MIKYKADNALAIVMNPNNGKILAMSSRPNFSPSNYNDYTKRKRLIGEKSIKLVFGSEEKYIKQFKVVHERVEEIEDIRLRI